MTDSMELMTDHGWYAYLRLPPDATTAQIEQAVERLNRQAGALAATAPERSQQLRETIRSIKGDLLSGPEIRQRYDDRQRYEHSRVPRPGPPTPPAAPASVPPAARPARPGYPGEGAGGRLARFLRTGWTCPSCGKGAVPSEKFCTKCGTAIRPIQPDAASERDREPRPRPACGMCANPLGPLDVFCSKCGTRR